MEGYVLGISGRTEDLQLVYIYFLSESDKWGLTNIFQSLFGVSELKPQSNDEETSR